MSLKKILALLVLPLVSVFVIAGCASAASNNDKDDDDRDSSQNDDEKDEDDEDDNAPEAPAAGEVAEPGTRVGIDEWLTHTFLSTDDVEATISARLVGVEKVTDEQRAFLDGVFDEGELDGFTIWMLHVEEKKESGESIVFNSDYSYFDVVDSDGDQVQSVTVIGWDECETNSFDEAFDSEGAVLTQCFLAASHEGGAEPAGVAYTGGYEDDNPYSAFDGKPLLFIKD